MSRAHCQRVTQQLTIANWHTELECANAQHPVGDRFIGAPAPNNRISIAISPTPSDARHAMSVM
jgi:hypothetical protein